MGTHNVNKSVVLLALIASTVIMVSVLSPTLVRKLMMALMSPVAAFWVGLACAGLLWAARFRRTAIGAASAVACLIAFRVQ